MRLADVTQAEVAALDDAWMEGDIVEAATGNFSAAALAVIYAAPLSVLERVVAERKAEKEAGE